MSQQIIHPPAPPALSPAGVFYTLRSFQLSKRLPPASVVSDLLESGYLSVTFTEGRESYELTASALHLLKNRPASINLVRSAP